MHKPRVEIVFRRGKPVSAFLHLSDASVGRTSRQIPMRPQIVAHYDGGGHPSGVELTLPFTGTLRDLNEVLRELKSPELDEADITAMRAS